MKKIIILLAISLLVPGFAFAQLTLSPWTTGTSIAAGEKALSLSPTVVLSYDSDNGTSYQLTGANNKGPMAYAVEAGNQKLYQRVVGLADDETPANSNVPTADDDNDVNADSLAASWSEVGK